MQDHINRIPMRRIAVVQRQPSEIIRIIRFSGELCQITGVGYPPLSVPSRSGTQINDISPTARFRLLKAIARVDWTKVTDGCFVTLTYPDEQANGAYKQMTSHRHQIIRHIEKDAGKHVPMLWRKEWKPRLTGKHVGIMAPHFHIAVLGGTPVHDVDVNRWWTRIIGATRHVQTKVVPCQNGKHAALYMAKYLTKQDALSSILDNAAYLNITGRAWGWHRKAILPLFPIEEIAFISDDEFMAIKRYARIVTGRTGPDCTEGLTVIGPMTKLIREEISKMGLDKDIGIT